MKHFLIAMLTSLTLAAPASAFSIDLTLPTLSFPGDEITPATQSCVNPSALTACK
ncbi:MAG: hypothetical protein FD162_72 [Rhodobacteraceae bacterium]|uniref:hypothetical protein n=1 Tax=Cypionkella sp. TaxID=2811411 RepID=UPI001329D831|nr:hypothetical protein [Cypionkella sp.]KAF0176063.1 MAG: hypothetical protein FD162_72 [Paracoccaceae bacterium]MDO8328766.1 hypothetical protein [Cypionkella sp.]